MEVTGVLPVLHVGPYHPRLHWQVSGVRHSPPFSQCLLQTTTIQEVGQKQRRREAGWGRRERHMLQIMLDSSFSSFPNINTGNNIQFH